MLVVSNPDTGIRYLKGRCRLRDLPALNTIVMELAEVYREAGGRMEDVAAHPYTRLAVETILSLMPAAGIDDTGVSYAWLLHAHGSLEQMFFTTSPDRYDYGAIYQFHHEPASLPESKTESIPLRSSGNERADLITSLLPAGGIDFVGWCFDNLTLQDTHAVVWRLAEMQRPLAERSQEHYLAKAKAAGATEAADAFIDQLMGLEPA